MRISIGERLKPFSHTPGSLSMIPGTSWKIEAFPTLIRIGEKYDLNLSITGPVSGFTLQQDLEKNHVLIFGKGKEGYYQMKVQGAKGGIEVTTMKVPLGFSINKKPFSPKERLFLGDEVEFFLPKVWERLSLGVSRSQDWDLVLRRNELKEILPVLFGLGQKVPPVAPLPLRGTGRLLEAGEMNSFCRAAFSKILVPRWADEEYQGLVEKESVEENPSLLLQEAYRHIRRLFFKQEESELFFLSDSSFDAGRMTKLQVHEIGELDLEWASYHLRRVVLRATSSGEVTFHLTKGLHSFRVKESPSQGGLRRKAKEPFIVEKGKTYLIDQFHK